MDLLQGRDDFDEVASLSLVHFGLPHPSVRVCFGDHLLCLSKFRLVHLKKADIRAKVSAVQTCIRMRTRPRDDRYGAVAVCECLRENVAGEPLEIAIVEKVTCRKPYRDFSWDALRDQEVNGSNPFAPTNFLITYT
jgi:hypothetical protein